MVTGFIQYIEVERRYSALTVKKYRRDIEFFGIYLNGTPETSFDPTIVDSDDIKGWIMHQRGANITPSSINSRLCSLRSYYKWLHRSGCIQSDPTTNINQLKTEKKLPSFISESQMNKMLIDLQELVNATPTENRYEVFRDVVLILFIYSTGLRRAEVSNVKISDFEDNFSKLRVLGKGDKMRIIPILNAMQDNIRRLIRVISSKDICNSHKKFLFLTQEGARLSEHDIYTIIHKRLRSVGVQGKSSPHVLRHTFATHMMNGGADMRAIQELLGHSSLQTTQIYTHNSISELKKVYNSAHPRARKLN